MNLLQWFCFILSAIVSVLVGFILIDPAKAGQMFSQIGYWNILVCFTWLSLIVLKTYGPDLRAWFTCRQNWLVIALAIAATLFLYTREGGGFKITFDEHTISNIAKSLHFDRTAVFKVSSLPGIGEAAAVDKRPLLFPFLLATVHDIFGYSISNAFYLNAGLTLVFLLLLYVCATKLYNSRAGWFAILLASCSPIISQSSSGGGLDMINLVGILGCFLLALKYAERPESLGRFSSLIIAVALFSHARYESPFLVLPAIAVIVVAWFQRKTIQVTWTATVVPFFFIPIAWLHRYAETNDEFKQYHYDSDGLFSLDYIHDNLGHATNFLFSLNRSTANSPLLAVIGVASLVMLVALNITRFREWSNRFKELHVAQIFGLAIIAEFILILGFTYGQLDNPIVTRLGMPFILLLLLCSALGLSILQSQSAKFKTWIRFFIAICFIYTLPTYSNHSYTSYNMVLKQIPWVMDQHNRLPKGNYLYISYLAQEMELRDIGNMKYKRAISKIGSLAMHKEIKTFDEIFVLQSYGMKLEDGSFKQFLLPGNDLGPWFELETVNEISLVPFNVIRLSRVTKINPFDEKDKALRDSLLATDHQLVFDVGQEAYEIWVDSLP